MRSVRRAILRNAMTIIFQTPERRIWSGCLPLLHVAGSHSHITRQFGVSKEERDAAMRAGLALFFLIGKKHEDYQRNLIVTMPAVIAFRERHDPPFIAKIHRPKTQFSIGSRPGRIEMDLTEEQWRAKLGEVE